MTISYLTNEEVIKINEMLIKKYSPTEDIGVKDYSLLDSATNRPKQSAFGEDAYGTIYDKATALFESLAKNHSFFNANKRTAVFCLIYFLRKNNLNLVCDSKMLENLTVDFVEKTVSFEEVSEFIEEHCN